MIRGIKNLAELWAHLTGEGLAFGHAHSEIMWGNDNGRLYPTRFKNVASRRFVFRFIDGELGFLDVELGGNTDNAVNLCETYPTKFIEYCPRVNGDVPVREGLARLVIWTSVFANWTLKDWLTLAEIGWKPRILGKYLKGASEEDIVALDECMAKMTSTGQARLPETAELSVEWPKTSGSGQNGGNHKELWDTLAAEISKAVLGQTLTSDQGNRGSQSLGNIHNQVRKDLLEADAKGVAAAFREYVIKPYVEANFGPTAPVPTFRFLTEDAKDIVSLSGSVKNLTDAGCKTIPESWVRDEFGIPDPADDEPCLGASTAPDPNAPQPPDAPDEPSAPQPGSPDAPAEELPAEAA